MTRIVPIALAVLSSFAVAQDPFDPSAPTPAPRKAEAPWPAFQGKIHVEFHVITMPDKKAMALLPQLRDEKKIGEAWAAIETMIEKNEAKLVAAPYTSTTDRMDIELKEGEEVKYAGQNEAPRIMEAHADEAKRPPGVVPEKAKPISFAPTTFETRHVGIRFKSSVLVSEDGERLMFDATAEHVRLLKWDEFEMGRLPNNEKIIIKQPRFHAASSIALFSVSTGERVLLGNHRVPGKEGEMELLILRAWTTPRKETK